MANILEELGKGMWDSVKSPYQALESAVKGDFSDAWEKVKAIPGNQERHNSEILNAAGVRGWVGDHPGETAAGIAATVIGAPIIAGAFGGGGGAPVAEAVGMTPKEAILAGGGNAAEVGSISPAMSGRFGSVLESMGPMLSQGSQQSGPVAPAFKPNFQRQQQPAYGSDVMAQLASQDYNI